MFGKKHFLLKFARYVAITKFEDGTTTIQASLTPRKVYNLVLPQTARTSAKVAKLDKLNGIIKRSSLSRK